MQAKDFPGLYVIGELLDVDGESGRYNLQAAMAAATLAVQAVAKACAG